MLLVQASKDISQPCQTFKMGILEKIVNGFIVVYLKTHMMNIKGLFIWTLGSVIQVTQLISTRKKLFVSYLSITWIMTFWIHGNNRVLTITRITWITRFLFYLFLVLISFAYTFRNPVSMGLCGNTNDKNLIPIYVIKRTSGLCESLLQSVTQWLDQLDHQSLFVFVSISRITSNQRISDPFFQTNSP